jgi:hypothetical protein
VGPQVLGATVQNLTTRDSCTHARFFCNCSFCTVVLSIGTTMVQGLKEWSLAAVGRNRRWRDPESSRTRTITSRPLHLEQWCTNPGCQVDVATTFCASAPSICGSSVRNLLHVTLQVPRILRLLLHFWKICAPLT